MADLIDLINSIAHGTEEDTSDFEAFLTTEGLQLLGDFRSITNDSVRETILRMVSTTAVALRSGFEIEVKP